MGILTATIRFAGPAPTSTDLTTALCQHTGEFVSYEEERYELACPILKKAGSICAIADPQESVWELRTGHLEGSYLWYATLISLYQMGGIEEDFEGKGMIPSIAPAWAYKPWRFARKEYRWRKWRKTAWITLDEARRLGVE
jgi:hypothetical protein